MKKILIVEDELQLGDMYERKFRMEGYEVILARSSDEGLRLIKAIKPDLVILDLLLPGSMTGIGVLKRILEIEDLKLIPIIVLSNLDTQENEARRFGAVDYLVKANVSLDDLVSKVSACLNR